MCKTLQDLHWIIVNEQMKENLECPDTSTFRPNPDLLQKCNLWAFQLAIEPATSRI